MFLSSTALIRPQHQLEGSDVPYRFAASTAFSEGPTNTVRRIERTAGESVEVDFSWAS
jgi:hypothetical protein